MGIRDQLLAIHASGAEDADEQSAEIKAQAVVAQYDELRALEPEAPYISYGGLNLFKIGYVAPGGVEIWLSNPLYPPTFRIFNPTTLVEDPEGPIEEGGRHWREDPLGAVCADVLSRLGGPQ